MRDEEFIKMQLKTEQNTNNMSKPSIIVLIILWVFIIGLLVWAYFIK